MARTNRPDEAYHIPTLNFWFAISGIALLITSVGLILKDHHKPWKVTQREFRDIERTRLAIEEQAAVAALGQEEEQAKIAELEKKVQIAETSLTQQAAEIAEHKAQMEKLQQNQYKAKRDNGFIKAEVGDLKYRVETERKHIEEMRASGEIAKSEEKNMIRELKKHEKELEVLNEKAAKRALEFRTADEALVAADAKMAAMLKEQKDATAALDKARGELLGIQKKIAKIEKSLFNDVIRNAPVLDFIAPDIKVQQIVIKNIRDDYNFATVQKEDRCQTCHMGIDKKDYTIDWNSGRFLSDSVRTATESELWDNVKGFLATYYRDEYHDKLAEFESFQTDPKVSFEAWVDENIGSQYKDYVMGWPSVEETRTTTKTFAAHPDPELYLSSASPHPIETYGCTVCHEGRGHAMEFTRVYHTPQNEKQEKHWKEKYDWHKPKYWDWPQVPVGHVTGSCAKCHDSEVKVAGADQYNEGKQLVEQYGCYGCHRIEGLTGTIRESGPTLVNIDSKVSKEFAYSWVWNPRNFRPSTKMPHFFGNTNNSPIRESADGTVTQLSCEEDESPVTQSLCRHEEKTQQELRGIVAYLFEKSEPFEVAKAPPGGSVEEGERLLTEVGCLACHSMESNGWTVAHHGPDLSGTGSKLSKDFIYSWIINPKRHWEETRMPSLRLTKNEANDIAAYLASQKKEGWVPIPPKVRNEKVQDELLAESMGGTMPLVEFQQYLNGLDPEEKERLVGEKAIGKVRLRGLPCHQGFRGGRPDRT